MQRERGLIVGVADSNDKFARGSVASVYLLFKGDARPDRHAIRSFAEVNRSTTLTLDPAQRAALHVVNEDDTEASVVAAQAEALWKAT